MKRLLFVCKPSHRAGKPVLIDLDVVEVYHRDFNDQKYRPAALLKEVAAPGHLSRKTGRGFYTYEAVN